MRISLGEVLRRVDEYMMKRSPVHESARRIARTLDELGIPFAVAGALAVNAHGHLRTTGDIDILITPEGLAAFKERWLGRGWVEKFPGSKGLRDAVANVNVVILLSGEYPGDGKPKPVAFPHPDGVTTRDEEGLPILNFDNLLELKLASGMTAPHRPRDLDDVIQLIRANGLPRDYASRLDPYVGEKFQELWEAAQVEEDY